MKWWYCSVADWSEKVFQYQGEKCKETFGETRALPFMVHGSSNQMKRLYRITMPINRDSLWWIYKVSRIVQYIYTLQYGIMNYGFVLPSYLTRKRIEYVFEKLKSIELEIVSHSHSAL